MAWRRTLVVIPIVAAAFLGAVAAHDRITSAAPDYAPLASSSGLDGWSPPWPTGSAEEESCSALPKRWLVVGWDGADWDLILPLVEAGEMPVLRRLLQNGSYGSLATFLPSLSPALWTTVATGVSPARHGIEGFYDRKPRLLRWLERLLHFGRLERRLFSSSSRRVKAIWNLLAEHDRTVLVAGYHNTFPVEEVRGLMASNHLVQDSIAELMEMTGGTERDSPFALSLVYPPEHLPELLELQRRIERESVGQLPLFVDLPPEAIAGFVRRAAKLDRDGDVRPYFLLRALSYDSLNAAVAERYLPELRPDVALVHFQALDWAAHHFLYFHRPEAYAEIEAGWSPEERRRLREQLPLYGGTVRAFHHYVDRQLERLIEAAGPDTAILLLSDHGVHPVDDPDVPGFHDDGPAGIVVFAGPGLRRGHLPAGANLYDILPTLMAALGLPIADDLEGRVLDEAFCSPDWRRAERRVPTYESGERYMPPVSLPPRVDGEILRQLESLGYLE